MKFNLILLICIATATATAVTLQPNYFCNGRFFRGAVAKCAHALGVTQADIEDYLYLRWATSDSAKCFRVCVFNECKAFNPDDSLVENIPQTTGFLVSRRDPSRWPIAEDAAKKCMDTLPAIEVNRCETTEAFMRCFPAKSQVRLSLVGAYCDQYEGGYENICK